MTKALNHSALKAKLVSIFAKNSEMKAVSKMLTQNFVLEKTDVDGVLSLVMDSGETQVVRVIENRFVVIGYAKPKGAKNTTIFLNKSTPMTSLSARKVVVVDLDNRTIENGDDFDGFHLDNDNNVPVNFMLGGGLKLVTVRNYISHTQLYVATLNGKMSVTDNIKAMRAFVNAEIENLMETFSPENQQKLAEDLDVAMGIC
jgi:hypothetical protein